MYTYRICRSVYANDLSGIGAKIYGGRWNRPGLAVLYTSFARSLAILELLVHFESRDALKLPYSIMKIHVPDEKIIWLDKSLLPNDAIKMNDTRLWDITQEYFIMQNTLALVVPSMVVPQEYNILLNPQHPQYHDCKVEQVENFQLDGRLYLS